MAIRPIGVLDADIQEGKGGMASGTDSGFKLEIGIDRATTDAVLVTDTATPSEHGNDPTLDVHTTDIRQIRVPTIHHVDRTTVSTSTSTQPICTKRSHVNLKRRASRIPVQADGSASDSMPKNTVQERRDGSEAEDDGVRASTWMSHTVYGGHADGFDLVSRGV